MVLPVIDSVVVCCCDSLLVVALLLRFLRESLYGRTEFRIRWMLELEIGERLSSNGILHHTCKHPYTFYFERARRPNQMYILSTKKMRSRRSKVVEHPTGRFLKITLNRYPIYQGTTGL
jgi:hypothetical protein